MAVEAERFGGAVEKMGSGMGEWTLRVTIVRRWVVFYGDGGGGGADIKARTTWCACPGASERPHIRLRFRQDMVNAGSLGLGQLWVARLGGPKRFGQ